MGLNIEERRFPAIHVVAGGAFDAFRPLGKLSLVLILVAIGTFCEWQFLLKISVGVTQQTVNGGVLSHERVLGFRVIEIRIQSGRGHALPTSRVVAGRTTLVLKTSFMRIGMAVIAFTKGQAFVAGCAACIGCVALLTLNLLMQSSKRIPGFVVIKFPGSILPVDKVMALQTILAEATLVEIFVASDAGLGDSKERLA